MGLGRLERIGCVAGGEGIYLLRLLPEIGIRNYVIHREVRESSVCDFGKARRTGQRRRFLLLFNSLPWFSNENGMVITRAATLGPEAQFLFSSSPSQESVEMYLTFTDVAAPCRAPVSLAPIRFRFHQPLEKTHKV